MKIRRKRPADTGPVVSEDGTLRIAVCGSRDWTDIATIRKHLMKVIVDAGVPMSEVLIITGGARGTDALVEELCLKELGIAVARFPAAWQFWNSLGKGRVAGPVRNFWMLRWGQPHIILAFHPYLPGSKGTKAMIALARKNGITRIKVVDK